MENIISVGISNERNELNGPLPQKFIQLRQQNNKSIPKIKLALEIMVTGFTILGLKSV